MHRGFVGFSWGFAPLVASIAAATPAPMMVTAGEMAQIPALGLGALSAGASSADGELAAVGDRQGQVALIDLAARRILRRVQLHHGEVRALVFRGRWFYSGGEDGRVFACDWTKEPAAGGEAQRAVAVRAKGRPIRALAVSSRELAVGAEQPVVEVYELESYRRARLLRGHKGWVRAVAFSRSGRRLASGGHDGRILVWSAKGKRPEATLDGHALWVSALAFGAGEDALASAGFDKKIYLWQLGKTKPVRRFQGHIREAIALAFDHGGERLASASLDRTGLVWEVASGKLLARLSGHAYQVSAIAFSRQGDRLMTAAGDGYVRLWSWPQTPPSVVEPLAPPAPGELTLRQNTTGERARVRLFDRKDRILAKGLRALARMMRSAPDGRAALPDVKLARLLYKVAERFGREREIVVISGYRSPEYNGLRRKQSREVAEQSQHTRAQAIDFRIEGVTITALHRYVSSLKAGGVGLYPDSQFVHMDTGPVRKWQGI